VLENDSDPEGDALTVVPSPNAFVVINPDGSFTYTANVIPANTGYGFSFTYEVSDGTSSSLVWISISVSGGV
jgi:hypothetical protein